MFDLSAFLSDPAGLALKALLVAAFLDFVTGTFAAIRDASFTFEAIAAWLRKHLAGRVAPVGVLLAVSYWTGDSVTLAAAIAAASAYSLETLSSIKANLGTIMAPEPTQPPDVTATDVATGVISGEVILDTANPVPTD
jgi:hypothetical protein